MFQLSFSRVQGLHIIGDIDDELLLELHAAGHEILAVDLRSSEGRLNVMVPQRNGHIESDGSVVSAAVEDRFV